MTTGITKKRLNKEFHTGSTSSAMRVTSVAWLTILLCLLFHSQALAVKPMVAAGGAHTVGLCADGTVVAVGDNTHGQASMRGWANIVHVAAGGAHTVGLRTDGTVVAVGDNTLGQTNINTWSNIVQLAAGLNHTVGLRADGTVVAVGDYTLGQTSVRAWNNIVQVAAGSNHTVGLRNDGTVVAVGDNSQGQTSIGAWSNIVQVAAGGPHTVGLRSDGTVKAVGNNTYGQTNVSGWSNIVQVAAGREHIAGLRADGKVVALGTYKSGATVLGAWSNVVQIAAGLLHTVGLRADGTVMAAGDNYSGQTNLATWSTMSQVAAGRDHTIGLRSDGTTMAVGANGSGQTDSRWSDIVQVAAGYYHSVGLRANGTVVAAGANNLGQTRVSGWSNIVQVAAGYDHTLGVRNDGMVVSVGRDNEGQGNVSGWTDIIQVAAGHYHSVGVRIDGTVMAAGLNSSGQTNVSGWTDIVQVAAGWLHTVGLRADGTVVAVGRDLEGQTNVNGWSNIVQVAAGYGHTVGLRADGTVVAVGRNDHNQTNMNGWSNIVQVAAGGEHTVGVTESGKVIGDGSNSFSQINMFDWRLIAVDQDYDGDGFPVSQGDCNDFDPAIHPGAVELCDVMDNNCNGSVDEGFTDADNDGFPACAGDCNDNDKTIHPGAAELCDGVDNNCNGNIDEVFADADNDGFPACAGDCNDNDKTIHPNAAEICDGVDNNCNKIVDEGFDKDNDGYTTCGGDCNDDHAGINPSAAEICSDGVDNDCDGIVDENFDNDNDGYTTCMGDCDDADPSIHPGAAEICLDGMDNDCNGLIDISDPRCAALPCTYDAQCGAGEYCKKTQGNCDGIGFCAPLLAPGTVCPQTVPVCGCDGKAYTSACAADKAGINVAATGQCAASGYRWRYYFPAITDNDAIGWENYLTVAAKDPVAMDVTIRVHDMAGILKGTYIYSDIDPAANAPAIPPYARVAARPSMIAGTQTTPIPVEGSMIVETSVPAIATTNTIANHFEGFSIYEAAKPRTSHRFPKTYDGPNNYQVSLLAQNIHATPVKVTVQLFGKTATSPGHGATKTVDLPAYATLKVRPSDVAGGINFDGSVFVTSDLTAPGDGMGLAIPAMCRYELGKEAMSIYESTARLPLLSFPVLKDGKFGGSMDYQNYLSVVNPTGIDATVEVVLYANSGTKKATTGPVVIPGNGKSTWRPSMIVGSVAAPVDFEGSAVVLSTIQVVGQTNTIYPGVNQYNTDAFDLFESAMPAPSLFFPKLFDNIVGTGHLYDNFVYVQNPEATAKSIVIEQFNNNGLQNGHATVSLAPYATHVYRPKDLVTDGTAQFRGSVRVTETSGAKITGAIKYDIHQGTTAATPVDAMTLYRSMGQ